MRLIYIAVFSLIVAVAGYGIWSIYGSQKEIKTLSVSAGPRGSDAYVLMQEISEVMERHSETVRPEICRRIRVDRNRERPGCPAPLHSRIHANVDLCDL